MPIRIFSSYHDKQRSFEVQTEEAVIGRYKEGVAIDIDLTPDSFVSRPHARLWIEHEQYWLEDLGSSHGTLVSGEEIKGKGRHRLDPDDTIQIGDTILRVVGPTEELTSVQRNSDAAFAADLLAQGGSFEVGHSIAADPHAFPTEQIVAARTSKHLGLLYELPLQFAKQARLESLTQIVVERLVDVIPGAVRGALLVRDRNTNRLLLKAHVPSGNPSASITLAQRAIERREAFIWRRGEDETPSLHELSCWSGMYAPLLWENEALGVICVDNPTCERSFDEADLRLLLAVARYAGMALANRYLQEDSQQNANLLARLLTNFSPKIGDTLLKKARSGKLRLGGDKSEVTVLCADIRGFTRISATMDVGDVMDMLNEYFAVLVDSIFRHDGTVDKFVGDAILAVFGSPEPDLKHHENAIRSAMLMQTAVNQLNGSRRARGLVTCNLGIGLNCGEVLHGFVGSPERMEFTVIGDAVNKASRFCDGAEAGEILISPELHQHVWRSVVAESVSISTKHEGALTAYRVTGMKDDLAGNIVPD